jgi:hypothetical protein
VEHHAFANRERRRVVIQSESEKRCGQGRRL